MKLITAAVFSVALLKRKLTRIQWISLFLLCVGVSIAQMQAPSCDDEPKEGLTDIVGILATMALVSLSGFAGVYTEKVLKGPATADVPFCFLQILLALVSLFLGSVLGLFQDMHLIGEYGFFHNFNLYTYLTVVVSAAGGLLVAATLKYASSIAKGYAVSVAIVTTGIASRFLFNTQLSMHFWLGVATVVSSLALYNEGVAKEPAAARVNDKVEDNEETKIEFKTKRNILP